MAKQNNAVARQHAEELEKSIRLHESSWDDNFRSGLARHKWSQWMSAERDPALALSVCDHLNELLGTSIDEPLSVKWYEEESDRRRSELIESQDSCVMELDEAKASLEAASERKKAAQAAIDEGHSRLRSLARELKRPFVYQLPPEPSRQRELPLADGEEWRAVPLSEALSDVALRATVLEKLGNVTLGQYADLALKFGTGDKPKKLTRKQWDRVEECVQKWHASQKK